MRQPRWMTRKYLRRALVTYSMRFDDLARELWLADVYARHGYTDHEIEMLELC